MFHGAWESLRCSWGLSSAGRRFSRGHTESPQPPGNSRVFLIEIKKKMCISCYHVTGGQIGGDYFAVPVWMLKEYGSPWRRSLEARSFIKIPSKKAFHWFKNCMSIYDVGCLINSWCIRTRLHLCDTTNDPTFSKAAAYSAHHASSHWPRAEI